VDARLRILLIDDHSLLRESLCRLLEADGGLEVGGSVSSNEEALELLKRTEVEVVLFDFDLGEQQGIQLISKLRDLEFDGKVLMVTAGMREEDVARAIQAGSVGVLLKYSPPADLITAIYRVAQGELWLDPRTVRALAAKAAHKNAPALSFSLRDRERAVLKGLFEGSANKEIAADLRISESSVNAVIQ
jgi:two-component system nitrate/nitrite response regulator NarL